MNVFVQFRIETACIETSAFRQRLTVVDAWLKEMRVRIALTKARKELSLDILFYLYVAISGRIIEYNLHT